jgi:hypothetical protein
MALDGGRNARRDTPSAATTSHRCIHRLKSALALMMAMRFVNGSHDLGERCCLTLVKQRR